MICCLWVVGRSEISLVIEILALAYRLKLDKKAAFRVAAKQGN
jgi:hypothetical protein